MAAYPRTHGVVDRWRGRREKRRRGVVGRGCRAKKYTAGTKSRSRTAGRERKRNWGTGRKRRKIMESEPGQ